MFRRAAARCSVSRGDVIIAGEVINLSRDEVTIVELPLDRGDYTLRETHGATCRECVIADYSNEYVSVHRGD